jgi:uncharacterized membrane protein
MARAPRPRKGGGTIGIELRGVSVVSAGQGTESSGARTPRFRADPQLSRAYSALGNTDEAELEESIRRRQPWIASEPQCDGANESPQSSPVTLALPRLASNAGACGSMITEYVWVKYFHILIAILALGTSAGLGIVLEFYGGHPTHGPFLLRVIGRTVAFFVIPGYLLVLVTGLWMVNLSWPLTANWIQAALVLWGIGIVMLSTFLAVLRKELRLFESEGTTSGAYQRVFITGTWSGCRARTCSDLHSLLYGVQARELITGAPARRWPRPPGSVALEAPAVFLASLVASRPAGGPTARTLRPPRRTCIRR